VDWIGADDGWPCLVGLKTAADAAPHAFGKQCARLDYHLQTAFYADGYEAATGKAPRVVEIVVESTQPHDVVTYIIGADVLEIGRDQYRQLLELRAACVSSGEWPGQGNGREVYLQLPRWAVPDDDDTSDLGLTGWKDAG
jgi:exodeoxyribonuclease VIII